MITQLPISTNTSDKRDVRTQFSALCYRVTKKGKLKILLITSRGTGRWILPKGWPMDGRTPAAAAAQEAWEEAGVRGTTGGQCLGLYSYQKRQRRAVPLPVVVMAYPLAVTEMADDFPEQGQRVRKWFSPKKAAGKVQEPELARILQEFCPEAL
jgi:8-oxo-dGTP pyrophosphatase MutT (NUDIX family)